MPANSQLPSSSPLANQREDGPDALHDGNLVDLKLKAELFLEGENQMHLLEGIPGGNRVGGRVETDRSARNPKGARNDIENTPLDLVHDLNPVR
jgi:hypothetical protein